MDVLSFVIAAGGLATAVMVPWIGSLTTARRESEVWIRDQRLAAYLDAMAHAQSIDTYLKGADDPQYPPKYSRPDSLPPLEIVTARMRLLSPKALFKAWEKLVESEDSFHYEVFNYGTATPVSDFVDTKPLSDNLKEFYAAMDGALLKSEKRRRRLRAIGR
ncbi:hypothetical protein [Cumulibacter manganitolerans]|uniref:hypothetical protein n=1 Tax=Cumulibacter manganitolerans TaxID=1884992 RepID=UPI001296094D|nr:hypothetical protein [Cumulibacter manganitolerans]